VEFNPNQILPEIPVDKTSHFTGISKINTQYLFSLIGFGIGSIISFIIILAEEYSGDVSVSMRNSNLHHFAIPVIFGLIGAFIAFIYGKKRVNPKKAIYALFLSQKTLSLIFDNLPVLISYLDTDLRYRFVNKAHETWLGLSLNDIYGKHIKDVVGEKAFERISVNISKSLNGENSSFESSREIGGKERFTNSTIIPHLGSNKKVLGFFTIVADITELKKKEQKIKEQNQELTDLNTSKDKFFSIIAHDLRGPLGGLMGLTELIADETKQFTPEQNKELKLTLSHSTRNIYTLLENLLEWSQIQQGNIAFSPQMLDLRKLVNDSMKFVAGSAEKKAIEIIIDIPAEAKVFADTNMLQTAIRNLATNAVKFTQHRGTVTISFNVADNGSAIISVKDTGIGMSKKLLDDLLKLDVDTRSKGTNGEPSTGLGLILCKEFVEKHGGNLWVESEEGKGSEFSFSIPQNAHGV
jgi:PAS domain S-box-containing protein